MLDVLNVALLCGKRYIFYFSENWEHLLSCCYGEGQGYKIY